LDYPEGGLRKLLETAFTNYQATLCNKAKYCSLQNIIVMMMMMMVTVMVTVTITV
jgi:hypothetical protein